MNIENQNNASQDTDSDQAVKLQSAKNRTRHKAMVAFIYPAILGSAIYGIFDYGFANGTDYKNLEFWLRLTLVLVIVILYYFDMQFTR